MTHFLHKCYIWMTLSFACKDVLVKEAVSLGFFSLCTLTICLNLIGAVMRY